MFQLIFYICYELVSIAEMRPANYGYVPDVKKTYLPNLQLSPGDYVDQMVSYDNPADYGFIPALHKIPDSPGDYVDQLLPLPFKSPSANLHNFADYGFVTAVHKIFIPTPSPSAGKNNLPNTSS